MIRSMTAFARQDATTDSGAFAWEIRTVNHRYLELHFRLPENFRDLEPKFRDAVRKKLQRGKVECTLKYYPFTGGGQELNLNLELVKAINHGANQVNRILDNPAHVNALEILHWPGVMESDASAIEPLKKEVVAQFGKALQSIVETREGEGAALKPLFEERLEKIEAIVAEVRQRMPVILQHQRESLLAKFEDAKIELEPTRLEQEMVMLAQKSDVAEELDRLDAHVKEVSAVFKRKEPIGRRLDFLMQELNREANTLSSKSIVTETTQAAVDLKVLIEQMREQVQNVE